MKNLVTVLVIATLAIASSVVAQDPQATFAADATAPAAPSKETDVDAADASMDEALWNKDKHHHHKVNKPKQCKPVIIALPIPESESECKKKCEAGCDDACEAGENKCTATCVPAETCKAGCTSVADCKAHCTSTTGECSTGCDVDCVTVCEATAKPKNGAPTALHGLCTATCVKRTPSKCLDFCTKKLSPVDALDTDFCDTICGIVAGCSETCTVTDTNCQTTCETCHTACETACDVSEDACKDACAAGGEACKIFTGDVAACKAHCKPCEDVCKKACYADQGDCERHCKTYLGSEDECWGRCKRDCPAVCDSFCARCNAESLAANAPELPATDATVSEQLQPIAPATDATVSEQLQPIAPAPAAV